MPTLFAPILHLVEHDFDLVEDKLTLSRDLVRSINGALRVNRVRGLESLPDMFQYQGEQGHALCDTVYLDAGCGDFAANGVEDEGKSKACTGYPDDRPRYAWVEVS